MRIISWNIQCGLGVDGRVDLGRIASVIGDIGPADVICLQEVARFNPEMDGGACHDQLQELAEYFQGYEKLFGAAIDRHHSETGRRWQFGNAILTNLPIFQTFAHSLPQPAPANPVKHMPRQALEAVVIKGTVPWRIVTTHLEFGKTQRVAQMQHLRSLFEETLPIRLQLRRTVMIHMRRHHARFEPCYVVISIRRQTTKTTTHLCSL